MDEFAKMPEYPVFDRAASAPDSSAPFGEVVERLAALSESVRGLFAVVMAAQADRSVAMADLAPVVASANQLERAASAVTIAATAGYARREEHDHLEDITVAVESIRAVGFVHEWSEAELGQLLRLSPRTASARVGSAAQLTARFPRVLAAVAAGAIEAWQADKAVGFLAECGADDETARAVDAWLGPRLATADPTRILSLTRYALGRIAPHLLPGAARRNRARRAIERWEVEPGLCEITARMPTHQGAAIWAAATTLAKDYQQLHPELTLDQARLDAFVDLALANVTVTTHLTLGVPVVTTAYARTGETPTDLLDDSPVNDGNDPSYHCDTEHDPTDTDPPDLDPHSDPPDLDPHSDPPDPWTDERNERDGTRTVPSEPAADTDGGADGRAGGGGGSSQSRARLPGEPDAGYRGPGVAPVRVPAWAAHPNGSPPTWVGERERRWWLSGVHLPGIGYIPPDIVTALTAGLGSTISVALLDAERAILLAHATDAYKPTRAITELVRTRDRACRFFGCTRPATGCDLDHAVPHHRHGPTSAENLAPLCRRHHRAKQRREWTYRLDPDTGAAWWTNTRTGSLRTTLPALPTGTLDPPLVPAGPPLPAHHEDDRLPTTDYNAEGAEQYSAADRLPIGDSRDDPPPF